MIPYLIGALVGAACTGLAAGLIAEWQARHAYPPEPQRVTPADLRPITDAASALARALRESHRYGADELTAIAGHMINLERRARGLPPMQAPRLTDADVGPLLRRAAEDVSRPR